MTFEDLGIQVKYTGQQQQKVRCPNCKILGKTHLNDTCLSVNILDGVYNCHKCGWTGTIKKTEQKTYQKPQRKNFTKLSDECLQYCSKRGITQDVVIRNKLVTTDSGWIVFPYFENGELINFKSRTIGDIKDFRQQTGGKQICYKYDDIITAKEIIITEGEWDSLSYEVAGFLNTTSVSQGAPNEKDKNIDKKLECITNSIDAFEQAETIYIATDNDANGIRLRKELIRRFGFEKCKLVDFKDCKDANEYLLRHGVESLKETIKNATEIKIEGVFTVADVRKNMISTFRSGKSKGTTTYYAKLDKCWTWKTGDVNLVSGYMNEGKSSFLSQLMILKAKNEDWKFAIFTPENYPLEDFFDDLASCYIGKPVDKDFPGCMSEDEYNDAMDFIENHFYLVHPEENYQVETITEKFSFLVRKYGVRGCVLDPYNQIEHLMERGEREDLYISRFMSKLKKFSVINDVAFFLVAHQLTPRIKNGEADYPRPDAYAIKGGGTFADKADNIILVWRPLRKSNFSSKLVLVAIEKIKKQRLVGIPGDVEFYYSRFKNQYSECEESEKIPANTLNKEYHERKAEQRGESKDDVWETIESNKSFDEESPF